MLQLLAARGNHVEFSGIQPEMFAVINRKVGYLIAGKEGVSLEDFDRAFRAANAPRVMLDAPEFFGFFPLQNRLPILADPQRAAV